MDPAKEARAVLDAMAKSLLDDPSMPTPAPLQTPPADALRALMSGNTAGQTVGKGNSSEVYACQSNPRVVTRTVRQQDEVEWQRELSRLRRVPAMHIGLRRGPPQTPGAKWARVGAGFWRLFWKHSLHCPSNTRFDTVFFAGKDNFFFVSV